MVATWVARSLELPAVVMGRVHDESRVDAFIVSKKLVDREHSIIAVGDYEGFVNIK